MIFCNFLKFYLGDKFSSAIMFFSNLYVQKYTRLFREDEENRKRVEFSLLVSAIGRKGDRMKSCCCFPSCVFKNLDKIAQKVFRCIDRTGIFHQNINLKIISKCWGFRLPCKIVLKYSACHIWHLDSHMMQCRDLLKWWFELGFLVGKDSTGRLQCWEALAYWEVRLYKSQKRAIPCALDNGALKFLLRYEYFVHSVQLWEASQVFGSSSETHGNAVVWIF